MEIHLLGLLHLFIIQYGVIEVAIGSAKIGRMLLLYADVLVRVKRAARILHDKVTTLFFRFHFGLSR